MSDPSQEIEPAQMELAEARKPKGPLVVTLLVLVAAVAALVIWYALNRESPTLVVQRFMSAVKGDRWDQAYTLIDWPEGNRVDEKTFVQTAKMLRNIYTIRKYKVGELTALGDGLAVPVTVTISKAGLLGTEEITAEVPIQCTRVDGHWKVRPDLRRLLAAGGRPAEIPFVGKKTAAEPKPP